MSGEKKKGITRYEPSEHTITGLPSLQAKHRSDRSDRYTFTVEMKCRSSIAYIRSPIWSYIVQLAARVTHVATEMLLPLCRTENRRKKGRDAYA